MAQQELEIELTDREGNVEQVVIRGQGIGHLMSALNDIVATTAQRAETDAEFEISDYRSLA